MAISKEGAAREATKREVIDSLLLRACSQARENDEAVLRLRGILLSAPAQKGEIACPIHPGWLGEIAHCLEAIIEHLEDTAKVLDEVSRQVSTQEPQSTDNGLMK